MRIIHCADVHLDSRLSANLDERRAKARRDELLTTFLRMIDYAAENEVAAILIAGDLFDTGRVSARVRNSVENAVKRHPGIGFYLLRGNHDASGFLDALEEKPENLKLFSDEWTSYVLNPEGKGNIVLTGAELTAENSGVLFSGLLPQLDKFNIVMLHGQQSNYYSRNKAEAIVLGELKNRGIDYLALGHVHEYHTEELDRRGRWCYSGCLEGRGFDECGEHGFVLLDVDEESLACLCRFVPFADRRLHTMEVDVTGCFSSAEMTERIRRSLEQAQYSPRDMVKVVLQGSLDISAEKNTEFIARQLEDDFFFLKIYDETGLTAALDDFLLDESLKGEFVRLVKDAPELDDETRLTVIRMGLQALAGEDIV